MRANSSVSSLAVVVLSLVGGCSPVEDSSITGASPEPPAPDPAPAPSQSPPEDLLRQVEQFRSAFNQSAIAETLSPPVRRLSFQCTDDVSFSVRSAGSRLEVFPPGHSHGYIVLMQQPSDSGLYYTALGAELRMNGDLATLEVGRDRYVDCVSNPAAAVWEDPLRGGTPTR